MHAHMNGNVRVLGLAWCMLLSYSPSAHACVCMRVQRTTGWLDGRSTQSTPAKALPAVLLAPLKPRPTQLAPHRSHSASPPPLPTTRLQELYGPATAGRLLNCFSRLFTAYMQWHGFTCGFDDLLLNTRAEDQRKVRVCCVLRVSACLCICVSMLVLVVLRAFACMRVCFVGKCMHACECVIVCVCASIWLRAPAVHSCQLRLCFSAIVIYMLGVCNCHLHAGCVQRGGSRAIWGPCQAREPQQHVVLATNGPPKQLVVAKTQGIYEQSHASQSPLGIGQGLLPGSALHCRPFIARLAACHPPQALVNRAEAVAIKASADFVGLSVPDHWVENPHKFSSHLTRAEKKVGWVPLAPEGLSPALSRKRSR